MALNECKWPSVSSLDIAHFDSTKGQRRICGQFWCLLRLVLIVMASLVEGRDYSVLSAIPIPAGISLIPALLCSLKRKKNLTQISRKLGIRLCHRKSVQYTTEHVRTLNNKTAHYCTYTVPQQTSLHKNIGGSVARLKPSISLGALWVVRKLYYQ